MSTCDYCGATIVWGRSPSGRRIPLDPGQNPAGNVALSPDMTARVLRKTEEPGPGEVVVMTHFGTCPNYHRKKPPRRTS